MKPLFERLIGIPDEGFVCREIRGSSFDCPWHVHAEHELILVLECQGYRIVGDDISPLGRGDLVFIGEDLPHVYQSDEFRLGPKTPVHAILVQFEKRVWDGLLEFPALNPVRRLLNRASLGLHVSGRTRDEVALMMEKMLHVNPVERIALFLTVLDTMARSRRCTPIASPGFVPSPVSYDQERINCVYLWINEHLDQPIRLPDAARVVHLSDGAFSRFFRAHLGKSFPEFVNELRIGRACRLLAESETTITRVALGCGYRNLSNFNRQFLRHKGVTPREFRRRVASGQYKEG